eukprot:m.345167 g.345167  ORF g.345167 m.345167 type:complete len:392 (-) comp25847_c0_seq1:31-1206(-)
MAFFVVFLVVSLLQHDIHSPIQCPPPLARMINHTLNSPEVYSWYSDRAMPVVGMLEAMSACTQFTHQIQAKVSETLDAFLQPGGGASNGLAGEVWQHWCDMNGVPPLLFILANRSNKQDEAVIKAFSQQAFSFPYDGKVSGLASLPSGAVARSTSGLWVVPPLPAHNNTQITWPDDCFMCTTMLSHSAIALSNSSLIDEATARMLGLYNSRQQDVQNELVWHGYDTASDTHSCCKWGDGNGWLFMGMADALRAYTQLGLNTHLFQTLRDTFIRYAHAWIRVQDNSTGLWFQLLDDNTTFLCTSGTGFATYAIATGINIGVLSTNEFQQPLTKAWTGLKNNVQADGSVANLSPGFGILNTRDQYMQRTNTSIWWGYGAVVRAGAAMTKLNIE